MIQMNAKWNSDTNLAPVPSSCEIKDGILFLSFGIKKDQNIETKSCQIDLKKYANSVVQVQLQDLEDKDTLVIFRLFNNFSYANGNATKANNFNKRIARVFVNEDGSDADIQWMTLVEESDSIVNRPEGLTHMAFAIEKSAIAKKLFDAYKKKSELIGEIDYRDSIAYLEAQVDALTRYVLSKHMDDADPELKEILLAANTHSILDIKSKDKLIAEMDHKAHVRNEQQKYYNA